MGFPGLEPPSTPPEPSLPPAVFTGGEISVGFPGLKPPPKPPGPSFPPAATRVVTTVTVCEHEPTNGMKFWPWVEVMVAVHGIFKDMSGILTEGVTSEAGALFGGDAGGFGSLGGEGGFGDSAKGTEIVG